MKGRVRSDKIRLHLIFAKSGQSSSRSIQAGHRGNKDVDIELQPPDPIDNMACRATELEFPKFEIRDSLYGSQPSLSGESLLQIKINVARTARDTGERIDISRLSSSICHSLQLLSLSPPPPTADTLGSSPDAPSLLSLYVARRTGSA